MSKKTKIALLIGAVAAVVSAVVLVIVFWDKLLSLCPCRKQEELWDEEPEEEETPVEEEAPAEEEAPSEEEAEEEPAYSEEECNDFADLETAE